MIRRLMIVALLAVSGCSYSLDAVRQSPVAWQSNYSVPYETMANCLSAEAAAGIFNVTPQFYPREQRAQLLLSVRGIFGNAPLYGEYEIATMDSGSTVRFRPGKMLSSNSSWSRTTADRCGNG